MDKKIAQLLVAVGLLSTFQIAAQQNTGQKLPSDSLSIIQTSWE